jgi:serine phosphatase RsbU (regulator of sigma subunit)
MVLLKLYPDGRVEYMNCGHIQPLLIHNGKVSRLEESNLIVGLLPGATYTSSSYKMKPGERILLATDGLVEAENSAGEPFGDERLSEVIVKKDLNGILEDVGKFQANNEAQDDCTVVEVQYSGGSGSSAHKTG